MPTIASGSSQTFTAQVRGATFAVAINSGTYATVSGSASANLGPVAARQTFGPFDIGQGITVSSSGGSVIVEYGDATPNDNGVDGLFGAALQAMVSGDGNVSTSRAALAADNGATLELADGVTYTLSGSVALPAGVVLMGPSSGTATLACTGGATINGGTSSVSITAGQVYSAIPRRTSATAFVVKGS